MENHGIISVIETDYDMVKLIKKSEKGDVSVVRNKKTGERFVFRKFLGKGDVYKKLMDVSCPNLPKIIAVEESSDMTAVLEEYVSGDTLFYLLKGDVLSPEDALEIILQLCDALDIIHKMGAVHRDIKPENIIIQGNRAVLIDFDASRMVDPEKSTDTKILGTTGYAPPEQYGLSQTDSRSDIYSLGVVLNVMLTGEHPSIKLADGMLGEIIQKCTMINPESRFQSASELREAVLIKEKPRKKAGIKVLAAAFAVMVLAAAIVLPGLSENEIPSKEQEPTEIEKQGESDIAQDDEQQVDFVEIKDIGPAKGVSTMLEEDFYDYWSTDEIITENIEISAPGRIEKYIDYWFEQDVLILSIGKIPEDEWKAAVESISPEEKQILLSISVDVPEEEIVAFARSHGNGPTYSILKRQEQSGIEIEYGILDPWQEKDETGNEIAMVVREEGKITIAPIDRQSIFYTVLYWKTESGEIIRRILPYDIKIEKDFEAVSFESNTKAPEAEKIDHENLWMNIYWEPVSNPERIVFRTVHGGRTNIEKSVLMEKGLLANVFEIPGYIHVSVDDRENFDAEQMANLEVFVIPPDARPRKNDESQTEWLESVYAETKYAGYKINAGGVGKDNNPQETADFINGIISAGYFYPINDTGACCANVLHMNSAPMGEKTFWYTIDYGGANLMIVDWYLENPEENPNAKPEKREYIYNTYESFSVTEQKNTAE